MTPEQLKALQEYLDSIREFEEGSPAEYGVAGEITPELLAESELNDVVTDPRYKENELAALRELERQSKEGLTAQDRADMARVETQANRANRGRIGAIQADMARRGASGSGMELVAQMQSAQSSNELAALKALEQEAMMQNRKTQATRDLGSMSASLQARDFEQQAAKARANDAINNFNINNMNSAQAANLQNAQAVANANAAAKYGFSKDKMQAGMAGGEMSYNAATEAENRKLLEELEKRKRKDAKQKAMGSALGGVAGGVAGAYFGGPAGAAAGAGAGSQLGGSIAGAFGGGYAHGGKIPGEAPFPGDDPRNDIVEAKVSPGEVVVPRSKVDAIEDLLKAAERLTRKGK